jgi:aerobic-type carbon monoxide dehydrogenase small subunit (CoxS/CutS family)
MAQRVIRFNLNGRPVKLRTDVARPLLWVLRGDFGLTGTKYGCGEGVCGACAVVIDGRAHRSCRVTLGEADGAHVLTVEGLAQNGILHPLQQAFIHCSALQCGFCTPGMLMQAYAMLDADPHPTREAIVAGMDRNLCRCGAYQRIVDAIEEAGERMRPRP